MPWPAPTNPCPENKKGPKNQKTKQKEKNYSSQSATTTSPVVSSYDFF